MAETSCAGRDPDRALLAPLYYISFHHFAFPMVLASLRLISSPDCTSIGTPEQRGVELELVGDQAREQEALPYQSPCPHRASSAPSSGLRSR